MDLGQGEKEYIMRYRRPREPAALWCTGINDCYGSRGIAEKEAADTLSDATGGKGGHWACVVRYLTPTAEGIVVTPLRSYPASQC
jgi:hypothetical protein